MKEEDKSRYSNLKCKAEGKEWRKEDYVSFIICLILSMLYFSNIPITAWTFHFTHANVFHLGVNLIALTSILYRRRIGLTLILAYISSSISWLIEKNAVGFSGIIFFIWGSRVISDMPRLDKAGRRKYRAAVILSLGLSFILPSMSSWVHFIPFVLGINYGIIIHLTTRYKSDLKDIDTKKAYGRD